MRNKLSINFEKFQNKNFIINDEYLSKLKNCLLEKGINEKEIMDKSKILTNIINYYTTMINNLKKNRFYIKSQIESLRENLEKKIIISKEMTENQFDEKIKNFIHILQNIFKLLQQKSMKEKLRDITINKEQMETNLKKSSEIYEEYSKILNTKIDSVFQDLIKKIDALINLGKKK